MDRCLPTSLSGCVSWKWPNLGGVPELLLLLSRATLAPLPHQPPLSAERLPLSHRLRPGEPRRSVPQILCHAAPADPSATSTTLLTISFILNTTTCLMPPSSLNG
jgi:hypothetical protein